MSSNKQEQIRSLLKGIETGDPASISVVNEEKYIQHNPQTHEGNEGLANLSNPVDNNYLLKYVKCHRILADGNFVLSVCEGNTNQKLTSFFDLFRLEGGKVVEHWCTTKVIPPRSKWKNNNGKF